MDTPSIEQVLQRMETDLAEIARLGRVNPERVQSAIDAIAHARKDADKAMDRPIKRIADEQVYRELWSFFDLVRAHADAMSPNAALTVFVIAGKIVELMDEILAEAVVAIAESGA